MNFSEYISAGRTFFFDTFHVVTWTTAMMIFTPERLFIELRHVGVLTRILTHARGILTLVITPRYQGLLMFILLVPVKYDLRRLFNQTTLLYVCVTLYIFSRRYSRDANARHICYV